ncbi:hypothetical protein C479_08908 [Halovivax asiaticus JCM 14624]|uniref:Uncharacterized protein n=1 Tax=Halovivax asiaticus JCM 14624 TaxID=1227490 RepID=M0BMS4_9EURY|nr:hypothetical protein [Halovivax asiaticus]ELZ10919.1 hypothetical protein C479_08908 [Halovivax asiaticus JCM 14624]
MTQRTRRRFLAVAGALGVSATAGCLSGDESDPDDSSDDGSTDDGTDGDANPSDDSEPTDESSTVDGTVLGDITLHNLNDTAHTVTIQVEIDSTIQSWPTKEIEAGTGGITLDRAWDGANGDVRVRARLDGESFVEVTPADWNDPDCLSLMVLIDQSGTLRITAPANDAFCTE